MIENDRPNLKLAEAPAESGEAVGLLDARILSSLLIKLKVEETKPIPRDAHVRLAELTRSPSIQTLLSAASELAAEQNVPGETALRQIVSDILELDSLWNQVLLKEGVARLTSQYH